MADLVQFELVSPERLLLSQQAEMVVVPGSEGDFGVMAGHSPLIAAVRPGVIAVFEGGRVTNRIFIAGGFAEVSGSRCTVLAEEAIDVAQLDATALEQQVRDLAEDVEDAKDASERQHSQEKLSVARAKLDAVAKPVYQ